MTPKHHEKNMKLLHIMSTDFINMLATAKLIICR